MWSQQFNNFSFLFYFPIWQNANRESRIENCKSIFDDKWQWLYLLTGRALTHRCYRQCLRLRVSVSKINALLTWTTNYDGKHSHEAFSWESESRRWKRIFALRRVGYYYAFEMKYKAISKVGMCDRRKTICQTRKQSTSVARIHIPSENKAGNIFLFSWPGVAWATIEIILVLFYLHAACMRIFCPTSLSTMGRSREDGNDNHRRAANLSREVARQSCVVSDRRVLSE